MSVYTREVEFAAMSAVKTVVTLPMPMRGTLSRLFVKQTSGTLAGYSFKIFNRRGASAVAIDLNVSAGGALTSIGDNGSGKCRFVVTAADAVGLRVGDTVEVKGNTVSGYNVKTHVVTAIVSTTQFDTNQAYSSAGTGGYWQTAPAVYPTPADPDANLVVDLTTVAGSAATSATKPDVDYENRDNQNSTARRRAQALYLEIEPAGTLSKNFIVSYSVMPALVY